MARSVSRYCRVGVSVTAAMKKQNNVVNLQFPQKLWRTLEYYEYKRLKSNAVALVVFPK
jgi:hypothetical protein